MNQIIEEGRRFASAADMKVSDMSSQSPVGTTLAILERTLKVMSAVQARIHYAMKTEFKLLKNIIRDNTPPEYSYEPVDGDRSVKQSDYDAVEIIPVSNPNAATMSQKVVQYQAVMQMAQANPDIYDMVQLNREMLEVLGIKNIDKLVPEKDDIKMLDPVAENMNILSSKPVKAFINQDQEAHIKVHMAFAKDPKLQQLVGQSPNAATFQAAMEAHVAEHIGFAYRKQIEKQLGVPLPPPEEPLPPDVEADISRLSARAGEQVLQQNTAEVQQQQTQQQAQDPLIQMQQAELQIKQQEAQTKAQKVMADIEIDKERLSIELQKGQLDRMEMESRERIEGAKLGAQAMEKDKDLQAKQLIEGARLGVKVVQEDKARKDKTHDVKLKERTERKDTKTQTEG